MKNQILSMLLFLIIGYPQNIYSAIVKGSLQKIVEKTRFAKCNEPSLAAIFEKTEMENGVNYNYYRLKLTNFPLSKGDKFILIYRNCFGKSQKLADAYVNDKLEIVLLIPKSRPFILDDYKCRLGLMSLGENVDIILATEDLKKGVTSHIVMLPLETKSSSGQRISIELRNFYALRYECIGDGYCLGEELKTISRSGNEVSTKYIRAEKDGTFSFGIRPGVIGRTGGFATITVERKNGESLTVEYPWGDKNVQPSIFQ